MAYFSDELHEEFCRLATAWAMVGAADLGEIEAIAKAFPNGGDDGAYYEAWASAAERHLELADEAEQAGHQQTALGHLWRVVSCFGVAIHVVFGKPVDPRMAKGFDSLTAGFERALAIEAPAAERFSAPFGGYELPGWFVPAFDSRPGEVRPLLILTNGYDATMADLYLGIGRTAAERGYHVLVFDGPGQDSLLIHHGIPMIPEWERVVTAVVDP